eukprot:262375_1
MKVFQLLLAIALCLMTLASARRNGGKSRSNVRSYSPKRRSYSPKERKDRKEERKEERKGRKEDRKEERKGRKERKERREERTGRKGRKERKERKGRKERKEERKKRKAAKALLEQALELEQLGKDAANIKGDIKRPEKLAGDLDKLEVDVKKARKGSKKTAAAVVALVAKPKEQEAMSNHYYSHVQNLTPGDDYYLYGQDWYGR